VGSVEPADAAMKNQNAAAMKNQNAAGLQSPATARDDPTTNHTTTWGAAHGALDRLPGERA